MAITSFLASYQTHTEFKTVIVQINHIIKLSLNPDRSSLSLCMLTSPGGSSDTLQNPAGQSRNQSSSP